MALESIFNYHKINDQILTGGMPTEEQIRSAAESGVQAVINLATFRPGNSLPEEADLVHSLGMKYFWIPVEWGNPTRENFTAFENLLQELGDTRLLIHCEANYRVSAFYALYAHKHLGWSKDEAEAFRLAIWGSSSYPVWEQFIRQGYQSE